MGIELLTERHREQIAGVLSCFDRIIIQGTLPGLCFADGMTRYLNLNGIRIFDYPRFAEPFRDQLRENAEALAVANGLTIDFIRKAKSFKKEKKIQQIIEKRGRHVGLVWIFSAMESCGSYEPWHDKKSGKTYLRARDAKCLHYYFYFIDEELGLCYVRVPTWCPFRLQVYLNGHNRLAVRLIQDGISHTQEDNAFTAISDFTRAQRSADDWPVEALHRKLDALAKRFCPIIQSFNVTYHWSLDQIEFATDIVFYRGQDLQAIYGHLTRTAIHAVKADNVATFLGRRLQSNTPHEIGNRYNVLIEGTRIKHTFGPASIKMYDKFLQILRLEGTINDVSFFTHYRSVEQKDGTTVTKWASMKKSIYSLTALRDVMAACNARYLEFISAIDDPSAGIRNLRKVSATLRENDRTYPGFNFFSDQDQVLFETLVRGEFNIRGFRNKTIRQFLTQTSSQVSRLLKRLRLHGLIKKVGRGYRYYLTTFGKHAIVTGLKLKELVLIPQLAAFTSS